MGITRRDLLAGAAALGGAVAAPGYLRARSAGTEIQVQYSHPDLFDGLMEGLARAFMAANPGIRVSLRPPERAYEEVLQRSLRDAAANELPDVAFHGINRQRTLDERGIPVDLQPFMDADPQTREQGYSVALLSLGRAGARQIGIGFALSTPILYYNADLLRAAGGVPDHLPTTWDGVIRLAAAMHEPAQGHAGLFYDWHITGNWGWQALVRSHGGAFLTENEAAVAFTGEPGRRAMRTLRRFVDEGRMPDIAAETAFGEFFAGRLGISMQSTAQLGRYAREIGGRFRLVCGRFPLSAPNASLPAGGNVAMMFARDPAKQAAAWEFIKFATGPVGATMMVHATGYMPATLVPARREDMLARFYRENRNHLVSIRQQDVIAGWYAFPGENTLRITDVINEHLQAVVAGRGEPDATNESMGRAVQGLLPGNAG